MSHILNS